MPKNGCAPLSVAFPAKQTAPWLRTSADAGQNRCLAAEGGSPADNIFCLLYIWKKIKVCPAFGRDRCVRQIFSFVLTHKGASRWIIFNLKYLL